MSAGPAERPLDIAFLVPEDRRTGTYFRFHNLAIALRGLGQNVTVYSQTTMEHLRTTHAVRDEVPYTFSPTVGGNRVIISPVNPGNIARRLLARVREADVYHLFQPYPTAAIPWLALRRRRAGLFAYDWDDFWINDEFGLKQPRTLNQRITAFWVRRLEMYLPRKCALLTAVSHSLAALARELGCPRADVVYNGVWAEQAVDRAGARRALGLQPDAFYAGVMGWSGEAAWAMEGLDACMDEFPRLRIAWCGKDPSATVALYPRARQRVDWLGFLQEERLVAFRHAVDLGIIPMTDNDFNRFRLPYKLTDFLSAGTPVLASDVGETTVVAPHLPGVAVSPPTREGWVARFREIVGRRSIAPAREDTTPLLAMFDWKLVATKLLAAYREVRASQAPDARA